MNSELENVVLRVDKREKNPKRIDAVKTWAESNGAIVEMATLLLCDYHLIGEFHGVSVNLGVEAKSLSDFCGSWQDLKDKLARARNELYDEVALFIESGNYTYTYQDGKAFIHNPTIRNGDADVCPLAVYEGLIDTLQQSGIHCRQLRSEAQFPDSLYNLLTYITNDHELIGFTGKGYNSVYKRTLQTLDGIGTKTANKLILHYPNLSWLSSACEDSLIKVIGKKSGTKLYTFLHCHELETDAWRNGHHLDGTDILMCEYEKKPCSEVNAYICIGDSCEQHPDYNKNLSKKKQDDEGRLAFDAPAKSPVKPFVRIDETKKVKLCQYADETNCEMINGQCTIACSLNPSYKHHSSHAGETNSKDIDVTSISPADIISSHPSGDFSEQAVTNPHNNSPEVSPDDDISRVGKPEPSHVAHSGCKPTSSGHIVSPPSVSNHKTAGLNPAPASKSLSTDSKTASLSRKLETTASALKMPARKLGTHDTSSHSNTNSIPPSPGKLDDPQRLPPTKLKSEEMQERFSSQPTFPSPAQTDIGLDGKPLEYVVRCRACHQVIIPEQDDDTGFCHDPECVANRKKRVGHLVDSLKLYLKEPHTVPEIVQEFGCTSGYAFDSCMNGVKAGFLKKATDVNTKVTTFQKVIKK